MTPVENTMEILYLNSLSSAINSISKSVGLVSFSSKSLHHKIGARCGSFHVRIKLRRTETERIKFVFPAPFFPYIAENFKRLLPVFWSTSRWSSFFVTRPLSIENVVFWLKDRKLVTLKLTNIGSSVKLSFTLVYTVQYIIIIGKIQ